MTLWSYLFNSELEERLKKIDPSRGDVYNDLVTRHYVRASSCEAFILSCANGIIIVVELSQSVLGIVQLLAGVLLSVSGLILSWTDSSPNLETSAKVFAMETAFAAGQFGFLSVYGLDLTVNGTWNFFLIPSLVFMIAFGISAAIIYKRIFAS